MTDKLSGDVEREQTYKDKNGIYNLVALATNSHHTYQEIALDLDINQAHFVTG